MIKILVDGKVVSASDLSDLQNILAGKVTALHAQEKEVEDLIKKQKGENIAKKKGIKKQLKEYLKAQKQYSIPTAPANNTTTN